jgi:hypothetical protein
MEDAVLPLLFFGFAGWNLLGTCAAPPCLAPRAVEPRGGAAALQVVFDEEPWGGELLVFHQPGTARGAFRPVVAASFGEAGGVWAGAGVLWRLGEGRFFLESSFLPGLWAGGGPELGSVIEFRSGLALGLALGQGAELALRVDHRSNGNLAPVNPGVETVGISLSLPLR